MNQCVRGYLAKLLNHYKLCLRRLNQAGFSLVEMSVVMASVAAVTVVVMGGSSIVKRTRLSTIISDVSGFSKAVDAFESKYKALPGDAASMPELPTAVAGNANGAIDTAEALEFWKQLSLAGLIKGKFDGASANIPGQGVPKGPFENSGYNVLDPTIVDLKLSQALVIEFSGFSAASNSLAILSPEDAKAIDKKMDDGNPNTGNVRAVDGTNATTNCVNGGIYNTNSATSKALGCRLRFIIRASGQADDSLPTSICLAGQTRVSPSTLDTCPSGTTGHVIQTCRVKSTNGEGEFVTSEHHCQPITCQGGKKIGEKRVLPCATGFKASSTPPAGIVQTCNSEGVWVTDLNGDGTGLHCDLDFSACPSGVANGDARQPLACNWGYTGQVNEKCVSGNWATTGAGNVCTQIPCDGGHVGDHRNSATACPSDYIGRAGAAGAAYQETCLADGTWALTSNTCVPTFAGSCTIGQEQDIGCPLNETGTNSYKCSGLQGQPGNWVSVLNTCAPITCSGDRIGSVRIIKDAKCPGGAAGVMIEVCKRDPNAPKGVWTQPTNQPQCAIALCDGKDRSGNASWPYAAKDTYNQAGVCLPGYTGSPTPTRNCDSSANWGAVSNPCSRTSCRTPDENANWINPYSKTYDVKGKCIWPDYEGAPTRDCDINPVANSAVTTWSSPSKSPCKPSALPIRAPNLTMWLDASDVTSLYSDAACNTQIKEGGTVRCWQDKSGHGYDATQANSANAPTYVIHPTSFYGYSRFNGLPVLNFNGSSSSLSYYDIGGQQGATTIFTVHKASAYSGLTHILGADSWTTNDVHYLFNNNQLQFSVKSRNPENPIFSYNYNVDDAYISSTIENNSNVINYVNGALKSTISITTPKDKRWGDGHIGAFQGTSRYYNGDIAEIIIYNRAIITSDRLDVERYLSQKWGIPITTPVSGAKLWLDGADATSIFPNTNCTGTISAGGGVGCWQDKSGNANNATGSNKPIYSTNSINGLSTMSFDGVNDMLTAIRPVQDDWSIITVFKTSNGSGNSSGNNWLNCGGLVDTSFLIDPLQSLSYFGTSICSDGKFLAGVSNPPNPPTSISSSGSYNNATAHISVFMRKSSTGNMKLYIDDKIVSSLTSGPTGTKSGSSNVAIGALCKYFSSGSSGCTGSNYLNANIAEIIIYDSLLSTSNRYAVETYLAKKWGVSIGPVVPVTAGMTVWLDGADNGTVFSDEYVCSALSSNGSSVKCWGNKSRNGVTDIPLISQGLSYVTGNMNGNSVVNFDTYTSSLNQGFDVANSPYSMLIVNKNNLISGRVNNDVLGTGDGFRLGYYYDIYVLLSEVRSSGNYGLWFQVPQVQGTGASIMEAYLDSSGHRLKYINAGDLYERRDADIETKSGGLGYVGLGYTGAIAEINIYNRALSENEICLMESYYGVKWGIPVPTCIGSPAIISTGLVLWLDGADSTSIFTDASCAVAISNNAGVGCWRDKRGYVTATQSTQASKPTYVAKAMNNNSILRFNGSSNYLSIPDNIIADGNRPYTFVTIVQPASMIGGILNLGKYNSNNNTLAFKFESNGSFNNYWWNNDAITASGAFAVNNKYILYITYDTSSGRSIYKNNTNLAIANGTASAVNLQLINAGLGTVGKAQDSEYLNGDIGEILLYNRALSSSERVIINNALGSKWGITVP